MSKQEFDFPQQMNPLDLESNAAFIDNEDVRHNFSNDEIQELKDKLFQVSSQMYSREHIMKEIKELINNESHEILKAGITNLTYKFTGEQGLKSLKANFAGLRESIENGYEIRKQKVYHVDYQSDGIMVIYDENGDYIYHRPLTQLERQMNIHSITKSA